jgi:integrase
MATKSFKPSHVELRHKTYFALLYVPKDVRHVIGKIKFYKSTQTGVLREAEAIASVWVINWKYQIKTARLSLQKNSKNTDTISVNKAFEKQSFEDNSILINKILENNDVSILCNISEKQIGANRSNIYECKTTQRRKLKDIESEWLQNETLRGLKQKTRDQMKRDVGLLYDVFPTANLLTHKNIEAFLTSLGINGKRSASSITRITDSCRNFYRYLKKVKEVQADLTNPFVVPEDYRISSKPNSRAKFKSEPWQPFDPEDIVYLYGCAIDLNDIQLSNSILIASYTGMRIEEISSLKCENVNLNKFVFKIIASKTAAGIRTIPIHSKIKSLVNKLLLISSDGYVISGLSISKYGHRSSALSKRFGRLKSAEGYGSQHVFHSIRKTFVTLLENAGISENVTADIVGHEKPRITYGLYSGGTSLKLMRESIEKISYEFPDLDTALHP